MTVKEILDKYGNRVARVVAGESVNYYGEELIADQAHQSILDKVPSADEIEKIMWDKCPDEGEDNVVLNEYIELFAKEIHSLILEALK